MNKLIFISLFLMGCAHHVTPFGMTKFSSGVYGIAVKDGVEFQRILAENNCGKVPCSFDDLGLTTVAMIGRNMVLIKQSARTNKEFLNFIGCTGKFVCSTNGRTVYIGK